MNTSNTRTASAFTRLELVVVVLLILILVVLIGARLPRQKDRADRIKCVGHLKAIGLAFKVFANDHNDRYPFALETNRVVDGVDLGNAFVGGPNRAYAQFLALSNELGTPMVLWCRGNRLKKNSRASDWSTTSGQGYLADPGVTRRTGTTHPTSGLSVGRDDSTSYLVGLNGVENVPGAVLAADFNLNDLTAGDGVKQEPFPPGFYVGDARMPGTVGWVTGPGSSGAFAHHDLAGNFALSDGSVRQATTFGLRNALQSMTNSLASPSLRWVFPY